MDLMEKIIKEEFLINNNNKIKDEDVTEYLNSFKKEELIRFAMNQIFIEEDYDNLHRVYTLKNSSKKDVVDYVHKNLEKILESHIKILSEENLEQLQLVIKNNKKAVEFGKIPISIHFINILKEFLLAKVEYNKKDDSLKYFMPDEYIKIFGKLLKNQKLLEINKYNNSVFKYSNDVINTYGIVTIDMLHELVNSQMFKIDKESLLHIISIMSICEEVYIYTYNENVLLCNLEFADEDSAIYFYENQKMNYRKYSKTDYKKISDMTYINDLKSYKKLLAYLCNNYEGILEDIDVINEFVIYDYIYLAQLSIENADYAFKQNIVDFIEPNYEEIEYLLKLVKNIFKEFPKWSKRGNV